MLFCFFFAVHSRTGLSSVSALHISKPKCDYCRPIHTFRQVWGLKIFPVPLDCTQLLVEFVDIVVLASPLYYWSISGQLKATFDRLFAIAECDSNYRNPKKNSVLIMAAEGYGFEESEYWYDRLEKHIGWRSLGKVLCGGVMAIGDIKGNEKLEEAWKLGASIQ